MLLVHFSSVSGKLNIHDKIPDDDFLVFKSLSVVMGSISPVLGQFTGEMRQIKKLLDAQNNELGRIEPVSKRFPIILFEGMPLTGHKKYLEHVAGQLGAKIITNPPDYLQPLLRISNAYTPEAKCAVFALGNYLTAMEIKREIKNRPVIISRYWYHTTAYPVAVGARNVSCLPGVSSFIYQWPTDLVAPDIAMLLTAKMNTLRERNRGPGSLPIDENLVYTYLEIYQRFQHPKPILIPCEKPYSWVKNIILAKIMDVSTPKRN